MDCEMSDEAVCVRVLAACLRLCSKNTLESRTRYATCRRRRLIQQRITMTTASVLLTVLMKQSWSVDSCFIIIVDSLY